MFESKKALKEEIVKLRLENHRLRRELEKLQKHQVFEHIFKIETDSDKCDSLFDAW